MSRLVGDDAVMSRLFEYLSTVGRSFPSVEPVVMSVGEGAEAPSPNQSPPAYPLQMPPMYRQIEDLNSRWVQMAERWTANEVVVNRPTEFVRTHLNSLVEEEQGEPVVTTTLNNEALNKAIAHFRSLEALAEDYTVEGIVSDIFGEDYEYIPPRTWTSIAYFGNRPRHSAYYGNAKYIVEYTTDGIYDAFPRLYSNVASLMDGKVERVFGQITLEGTVVPPEDVDFGVPDQMHPDDVYLGFTTAARDYSSSRAIKYNNTQYEAFTIYVSQEDLFEYLNAQGEKFKELGWELITAKVSRRNDVPIAAKRGNYIHVFFVGPFGNTEFQNLIKQICEDHWTLTDTSENSEYDTMTSIVRSILDSYTRMGDTIDNRRSMLYGTRSDIVSYRDHLASSLRRELELYEEIETLTNHRLKVSLDRFEGMSEIGVALEGIRPIREHSVDLRDGRPLIKFTTYPFNMDNGRYRVPLPGFEVTIDTEDDYIESAIKIFSDGDEYWYHPHIENGHCCFGAASPALAEAYGRRDWESLARIIVAFLTRYNAYSPYISLSSLREDYYGTTNEPRGWVYPQTIPVTEETSTEEPTIAEEETSRVEVYA
jgi:hypothetical protein